MATTPTTLPTAAEHRAVIQKETTPAARLVGGRFQFGCQLRDRHARLVRVGTVVRQSRAKFCALGIGDERCGGGPCGRGKGLLGQLTLALHQQFDFGWCQPSQFGRGTELLIQ